ncbi:nuclease [Trinickia symbiotica]|uniref:phosphodiesterase I n=1 Tax=Trinickia symbiotica TaxID=863227 RepID=A0A2T3XRP2_9BURK|nr:VRR-NUC domain-containing protein [Trinickia symbiotica]PTB19199.1 nuclease [Trinickia symbiotica]
MLTDVPSPLYYLHNFERALAWLAQRYDDLLDATEHAFLAEFPRLPLNSRALLVRMLMRKGMIFRTSRLTYEEVGCPVAAAAPLAVLGWVDPDPPLTIDALFALSTRSELQRIFSDADISKSARKSEWLDLLRARHTDARRLVDWDADTPDQILHVAIAPLADRLKLLFFGNLHQDWSEFVLADLGVYQYETVSIAPSARAFRQRADVEAWLALHACREALDAAEEVDSLESVFAATRSIEIDNAWLETRRAKLLFGIGQCAERRHQWDLALTVYERCTWPGARQRRMRVLERCDRFGDALALASEAELAPENEAESQRVARLLPRLRRRLQLPALRVERACVIPRDLLTLSRPEEPFAVEYAVRDHLDTPSAPVYYVENTLINSLFGLLCWEAVFAPVSGAFFHPFQRGPADLHAPDFHARRATEFARCLAQLDSGTYRTTIVDHFERKAGLQSPFVFWGILTRELLEMALDCLPAAHLRLWFKRLLEDIRENRSGLPDLVRFWPDERRYELVEVKGPGDRLQDNQTRWLEYCVLHGMPVRVVDVRWDDGEETGEIEASCATSTAEATHSSATDSTAGASA